MRREGGRFGLISVAIVALSMIGKTGKIHAGVMLWTVKRGPTKRARYWKTADRNARAT
jgi:hypothetical protein